MKYVNPTNDLAFKKVLGNNDNIHILAGFIKDFFFIDPKGLTVENPYSIKAYKELIKDEETYRMRSTISDVAAIMDFADYRSELQLRKESYFDERSIYYPLDKFVSHYRVVDGEVNPYARLRPIYSMSILGHNHYKGDEDALRVFQLYDPARKKSFSKQIINFGYFELLKPNVETENQRQWQNYFLQKPLANDAPDYIKDALRIIDRANMSEEEFKMMADVEYYQSIYHNQIHYAVNEKTIEIAKKMLKRGASVEDVVEDTGLDRDTVLQLREETRTVVTV